MRINPSDINAIYLAGLRSYYIGDLDESLKYFAKILTLDLDHDEARIMQNKANTLKERIEKGKKLFMAGNFDEACKIFTETLEINARNVNSNSKLYCLRAAVYKFSRNYEECIKDYEAALRLNRTSEIEKALSETRIKRQRYCQ